LPSNSSARITHQQVVEGVKPLSQWQLLKRKGRAGAERLAPDRSLDQPHGLVREAEDHFMVADDPAEAQ
jgi:hypothetical protein